MMRIAVFIDGFNVYHALQEKPQWHRYKWLDYDAMKERHLQRCQLPEVVSSPRYGDLRRPESWK